MQEEEGFPQGPAGHLAGQVQWASAGQHASDDRNSETRRRLCERGQGKSKRQAWQQRACGGWAGGHRGPQGTASGQRGEERGVITLGKLELRLWVLPSIQELPCIKPKLFSF